MIVAVAVVHMMQPSVDDIVDVVAVGHGFVAAARTMHVVPAGVYRMTAIGVGGTDFDCMLVVVVFVGIVQVSVVEIIRVVTVADGRVATAGAVGVLRMSGGM
jgi:hypothetical protein